MKYNMEGVEVVVFDCKKQTLLSPVVQKCVIGMQKCLFGLSGSWSDFKKNTEHLVE